MRPTTRTRKSRRPRRKGPVHLIQGLLLEVLGFGALIAVMLGLGRENRLLSLITSPVFDNRAVIAETGGEILPQQSFDAIGPNAQDPPPPVQNVWQPVPQARPFLSHNSLWTSHH